jgi:hypothetical protein
LASKEVAPSGGPLVTVHFIDELMEFGIWVFIIGRYEYYGGLVAREPLLEAVNDNG